MLKGRVQAEAFSPSQGQWWSRGWGQEAACPDEAEAARAVSAGGSLEQGWVLGSDRAVPSTKQGSHILPPPTNIAYHTSIKQLLNCIRFIIARGHFNKICLPHSLFNPLMVRNSLCYFAISLKLILCNFSNSKLLLYLT